MHECTAESPLAAYKELEFPSVPQIGLGSRNDASLKSPHNPVLAESSRLVARFHP